MNKKILGLAGLFVAVGLTMPALADTTTMTPSGSATPAITNTPVATPPATNGNLSPQDMKQRREQWREEQKAHREQWKKERQEHREKMREKGMMPKMPNGTAPQGGTMAAPGAATSGTTAQPSP